MWNHPFLHQPHLSSPDSFVPLLGLSGASWGLFGAPWGPLGSSWGHLGGLLGASWGPLGAEGSHCRLVFPLLGSSWGRLGALLGCLGASGAVLGPSWAVLGPSWGPLGPSWGDLGSFLGRRVIQKPYENQIFWPLGALLGRVLELFWDVLEASGAVLRQSWASWADRSATRGSHEPIWEPLGALLARLGALLGPKKSRDKSRQGPGGTRGAPGNLRIWGPGP